MNCTIHILNPHNPDAEARLCRDFLLWQGKQSVVFVAHTPQSFSTARGTHRPTITDVAHSFALCGFQEIIAHWNRFGLWHV